MVCTVKGSGGGKSEDVDAVADAYEDDVLVFDERGPVVVWS